MAMLIIKAWPPNIEEIKKVFDLTGKRPLFAWGHYIYNPYDARITEELADHEATHSIQQDEIGPVAWWKKYLSDKQFRLEQEIPAYQNQYRKACMIIKDRNRQAKYLHAIAMDMASPMYGSMIKYSEAVKLIKNGN